MLAYTMYKTFRFWTANDVRDVFDQIPMLCSDFPFATQVIMPWLLFALGCFFLII